MSKGKSRPSEASNKLPSVQWHIYVYTFIICIIHLIFGLNNSCFGPTFVDFKFVLNTTINWISLFPSFLSFGYMIGSLFGYLYKYVNRQITVIVFLTLMAISTCSLPFASYLWHFYLSTFGYGLGSGVWYSAYNVWIIEMWRQNSAPVLQFSQFMYGIGTIFGPMIDKPFLTGELIHSLNRTISKLNESMSLGEIIELDNMERRNKLHIPFLVIGSMELMGPVLLITMFLIKPYNTDCIDIEPKTEDKIETKTSTEVKRQSKASVRSEKIVELRSTQIGQSLLVGLLSNFVALVFVSDNIYLKFSATYFQYIDLQLTASQSAHLVIQMAIVYTLGRAMAVLVSIRIRPQTIMSYHIFILITSLVVIFFGQQNYRILWTGSLLLSLGFSAILPAIFAFVGQYIEVNNRMGTVIIFNCGSLNSFLPFILGTFIEYYPNTFLTIILINFSIAIVIFAIIIYLTNEPDS